MSYWTKQVKLSDLTHGVGVLAGHLVVADLDRARDVLLVVASETLEVCQTLLTVGLFVSCMGEVVAID